MKKLGLFLIINLFLLSLFIAKPPSVLGISVGDSCTTRGAISNCECPADEGKTCCCGCNGTIWEFYHLGFCEPGVGEPGAGVQIINPVLSKFGFGEGADILAQIIANFLKIAFSIAGLVLLAMLLWGAIQWMTAGGDKEQMAKAQGRITAALIGFVVFMSIFAIINFIAPALGLDFLQVLKIEWPTP